MQIPIDDPTAQISAQLQENEHTAASFSVLDDLARRLALITAWTGLCASVVAIPYLAYTDINSLYFVTPLLLVAVGLGLYRDRLSARMIALAFASLVCLLVFSTVRKHGLLTPMTPLLTGALCALAIFTNRRITAIGSTIIFGGAFLQTLLLRLREANGDLWSLTLANVVELSAWLAVGVFATLIAVLVLSRLVHELETVNSAQRIERERRWLAERGAQQSEGELRRVLDNAPMGITLLDEKGDITGWNRVNEKFLGVSSDQILGSSFAEFLARADQSHPLLPKLEALYEGLPFYNLVFEVPARKGVTHFLMSGKPIFDAAARVSGVIMVGLDISNLTRDALSHPQDGSVEQVAQLAHDIRSPLMALGLSVEAIQMLLEEEQPDLDRIRAKFPVIQQQQEYAAEVVEGYYSSLNQREARQSDQDPGNLALSAMNVLRPSFQSQHVELELDARLVGDELIFTQPVLVRQILINLLANARDAVVSNRSESDSPGWVRIAVEPSGEQMVWAVSDSGGGRLPTDPSILFNRGFTTKPVGEGTGMGLFIGRATAEHIGGTLDVVQGEHGLIFQLGLPRTPDHG